MNTGEINKLFLNKIDSASKIEILTSIAKHYGVSPDAIYAAVTDPEAENILDYMVGPARAAAHTLYLRHGFRFKFND